MVEISTISGWVNSRPYVRRRFATMATGALWPLLMHNDDRAVPKDFAYKEVCSMYSPYDPVFKTQRVFHEIGWLREGNVFLPRLPKPLFDAEMVADYLRMMAESDKDTQVTYDPHSGVVSFHNLEDGFVTMTADRNGVHASQNGKPLKTETSTRLLNSSIRNSKENPWLVSIVPRFPLQKPPLIQSLLRKKT